MERYDRTQRTTKTDSTRLVTLVRQCGRFGYQRIRVVATHRLAHRQGWGWAVPLLEGLMVPQKDRCGRCRRGPDVGTSTTTPSGGTRGPEAYLFRKSSPPYNLQNISPILEYLVYSCFLIKQNREVRKM